MTLHNKIRYGRLFSEKLSRRSVFLLPDWMITKPEGSLWPVVEMDGLSSALVERLGDFVLWLTFESRDT